jgi:hypothetical protein
MAAPVVWGEMGRQESSEEHPDLGEGRTPDRDRGRRSRCRRGGSQGGGRRNEEYGQEQGNKFAGKHTRLSVGMKIVRLRQPHDAKKPH